jgi:apolipoprotein N-acyltransferase
MRAIEQGRYLARAANTGISGFVDPYGAVIQQSKIFEAGGDGGRRLPARRLDHLWQNRRSIRVLFARAATLAALFVSGGIRGHRSR